jgi:hypothetical protein
VVRLTVSVRPRAAGQKFSDQTPDGLLSVTCLSFPQECAEIIYLNYFCDSFKC